MCRYSAVMYVVSIHGNSLDLLWELPMISVNCVEQAHLCSSQQDKQTTAKQCYSSLHEQYIQSTTVVTTIFR
jgi:hypothetical protein